MSNKKLDNQVEELRRVLRVLSKNSVSKEIRKNANEVLDIISKNAGKYSQIGEALEEMLAKCENDRNLDYYRRRLESAHKSLSTVAVSKSVPAAIKPVVQHSQIKTNFIKPPPLPEVKSAASVASVKESRAVNAGLGKSVSDGGTQRAKMETAAMLAEIRQDAEKNRLKRNTNYVDKETVKLRLENTQGALDLLIKNVESMQKSKTAKNDPLKTILRHLNVEIVRLKSDIQAVELDLAVNLPMNARDRLDEVDSKVKSAVIKAESTSKAKLSDRASPFKILIESYERRSKSRQINQEATVALRPHGKL